MSFSELSTTAFGSSRGIGGWVTHIASRLFGFGCMLVGFAMVATLWLIPLGIPLALVGVAFAFSSDEPIY